MEMSTSRKITEGIISGLKNAATELEEFQLQFALGKAEATDIYEELKKSFNKKMHEAEMKIDKGMDKAEELKAKFEALRVQLELGRAEGKEIFMDQKKKIELAIHNLEVQMKTSKFAKEYLPVLQEELEKFKIKLEILYNKYEVDAKKKAFLKKMEDLKNKLLNKESEPENYWDHFANEMGEAYGHLKNAFTKP